VTLALRAVDKEMRPVSGAWVTLQHKSDGGGTTGYGAETPTDEDGRFSWSGFEPGAEVCCTLSQKGYLRAETTHRVGQAGEVFPEETVVLYRSCGVAGRVVDENGEPFQHAKLRILANYADRRSTITCETDETGKFSKIAGVPATEVVLEIRAKRGGRNFTWISDTVSCLPDSIVDLGLITLSEQTVETDK
jgi:hypothetical protein